MQELAAPAAAAEPSSVGPRCRLCGAALTATFVDLGMSPLCERFLTATQLDDMEPFYPLHVRICPSCLLVQLPAYVAPDEIFREYAYFSSYSDSWVEHARRFADEMTELLGLGRDSRVVEVASNDGYLLQHFVARGIPVLGVDPALNVADAARARGVPTVTEFFGEEVARQLVADGGPADLIVANNVYAHVPDLNDVTAGLRVLLAGGGTISLEFPHLLRLVEGNQFDTIYHEHFSYFTLATASRALARGGLRVIDVQELATHGGSLRVLAAHEDDERPTSEAVAGLLDREASAGFDTVAGHAGFADRVAATKRDLLRFLIDARAAGRTVAGYGAPGKANTLLNYCGIGPDLVSFTVDRNPYKHGRFTPGMHIPIRPPEALDDARPDIVVILPWNLRAEIGAQLAPLQARGTRLVVPIPTVEELA
ncbi:MAG: methyltransferase domain-containing protein [Chloroflexota bacterium]